jgi:flagellar motor switch protein FliM
MHETFARTLSHSLDLFLGSPVEVKLVAVDQIGAREFGATLCAGSYLVPFSLMPMQERVIAKFESGLLFPLLDLLLGGPGDPVEHARELTEVDEELFRSVTELIAAQAEHVWKISHITVAPLPSVRMASLGQFFAIEERVVMLQFEIRVATVTSGFGLALPMSFASALVRHGLGDDFRRSRGDAAMKDGLRDRILQCDMRLAVELPDISIPLGEIVALRPGSVLDLCAPVHKPIVLRVSGCPIFEVTPARRGDYKSAQLNAALQNEV